MSFYITDNTKADLRYCLDCKLLPLVSLQIKQRGQIAMIDADACFGSDGRFGMNRHPGARKSEHIEVVRAVADGHHLAQVEIEAGSDLHKRIRLRLTTKNWLHNLARELSVRFDESVRPVLVETELGGYSSGKDVETTGNQRCVGSRFAHGGDQFAAARSERDAARYDALYHCKLKPFKQRHALPKRRFERDLSIHCARRDRRDMGLDADLIRQFVNAFLVDHGGIHAGNKHSLAAAFRGLYRDIHRTAGQHLAQGFFRFPLLCTCRQDQIAGDGFGQPHHLACADRAARHIREGSAHRGSVRIRDECCDDGHAKIRYKWKTMLKEAILIAGPTASGKSALALRMAADHDAIIVNTDSMQVYSVLRVLTARPGPDELAKAPHRLYGHVPPNEPYSTGNWVRDVEELIEAEGLRGKRVIFVGGTGLYFRALTQGLAPIPDVHEEVRTYWRSRLADEGEEALHRLLAEVDPVSASRIRPSDGQRILRALEVHETSGKPISYWQAQSSLPLVDLPSARKIVLMPERAALAGRIERRFDQMMQSGAIEEVEELLAFDLPPSMPAMKAIGVREIATAMAGEISLEEAASRAKAATRQYAKRQMTWFRHQLGEDWERMAV